MSLAPVPRGEPFRVEVVPERDVVRVVPIGEVDLVTAGELAGELQELRAVGFERLVLDLRRVEFIDSTGLHLILKLDSEARREGHEFAVIPGPPPIQRLFAITGIDERLRLHNPVSAEGSVGDPAAEPTLGEDGASGEAQRPHNTTELRSRTDHPEGAHPGPAAPQVERSRRPPVGSAEPADSRSVLDLGDDEPSSSVS